MGLLMRTAAALTCLLLVTACGSETTDTSGLVEPGFRTVLRVDLQPNTSFDDFSELQEKYSKFSGVQSGSGGVGEGVANALIIFSSGATADEIAAVRDALVDESSVEQVNVEHRK